MSAAKLPTAAQTRVLLFVLRGGGDVLRLPDPQYRSFCTCGDRGWITLYGDLALTPAGRAALASALLVDLRGPYVAVGEPRWRVSAEEVRGMVVAIRNGHPCGFPYGYHRACDALATYLLRGVTL